MKDLISEKYLREGLIWVNGNGIISSIAFPSLNLTFIPEVTKKGVRLAVKEFPKFFLLSHNEKGHCLSKDAFLIGKSLGNQMILIPADHPHEFGPSEHFAPYVALFWNKRRNIFKASSPEEELFFIHFLLSHKYYLQAKQSLDRLNPLRFYDKRGVSIFESIRERIRLKSISKDIESQWIVLRLLLHQLEHVQQMFTENERSSSSSMQEAEIKSLLDDFIASFNFENPCLSEFIITQKQKAFLINQGIKADALPSINTQNTVAIELDGELKEFHFPLEAIAQKNFQATPPKKPYPPFVLASTPIPSNHPLAQEMFQRLEEAHKKNSQSRAPHYSLLSSQAEVVKALKQGIQEDKKRMESLALKIEEQANQGLLKKKLYIHSHIIRSILKKSPDLLTHANSSLTPKDVKDIWQDVVQLMLVGTRIDQAKLALKKADNIGEMAAILYQKRLYDPYASPELLIYEYSCGIFFRPEQIHILNWISDHAHSQQLMVEFRAGGGKTKIFAPLLCFNAIAQKQMPIFFSLPATYPIVKEDLQGSLTNIFEIKTHVLEIDLATQLTDEKIHAIYALLEMWFEEGAAVVVTPVVYHKLHLSLYENLERHDHPIRKILDFFKSHCLFIIDEAHRNLISSWQAIIAKDEIPCFSRDEQLLFIIIYKLITGVVPCTLEDGTHLSTLINLKQDQQVSLTKEQKKWAFQSIAKYLVEHYFKIAKKHQQQAYTYLCNRKVQLPKWYEKLDPTLKDHLLLARGLLTQILPICFQMMHQFDYGAPTPGNALEMPRFLKMPTGAQFANSDLAAALTCQGLYPRGIQVEQFTEMIYHLHAKHLMEAKSGDPRRTRVARIVDDWQKEMGYKSPLFIGDLFEDRDIQSLHQRLQFSSSAIEYYLANHLLAKVKHYTGQFTSTAADLNAGAYKSILLTATLGMNEEFPVVQFDEDASEGVIVKRDRLDDLLFQDAVMTRSCSPENERIMWLEYAKDPYVFFELLHNKDPHLLKKIEGIIDLGGHNRHFSTKDVALNFLKINKKYQLGFHGAVFMKEQSTGQPPTQVILEKETGDVLMDVAGNDFLSALRKHGICKPEEMKLFKVFGPEQSTGTDLHLGQNALMLLTVGDKSTLWDHLQAILRCRRFLEENDGQTIIRVIPETMKPKIASTLSCLENEISADHIMKWCFLKELDNIGSRILFQACQSILLVFRAAMEAKDDLVWVVSHRKGIFFDQITRNLFLLYAKPPQKEDVGDVLNRYINHLLSSAGLEIDQFENEKKQVDAIIAEAKKQILSTQSSFDSSIGTIQAHQQQQSFSFENAKEFQPNLQRPNRQLTPLLSMDYARNALACSQEALIPRHNGTTIFSVNEIFGKKRNLFYDNLFFLANVCKTHTEKGYAFKPINFFLLVFPKVQAEQNPQIYCISDEDAYAYEKQLRKGETHAQKFMALCTSSGDLAQNGKENGVPSSLWEQTSASQLWQEIMTQIALLNVEITDRKTIQEMMLTWETKDFSTENQEKLFSQLAEEQFFEDPSNLDYLLSIKETEIPDPVLINLPEPLKNDPIANIPEALGPPIQNIPLEKSPLDLHSPDVSPSIETHQKGNETTSKTMKVAIGVISLIAALVGVVGGLSMVGGYYVHAPQFSIDIFKALPQWLTYSLVASSPILGLAAFSIYLCLSHSKRID